MMTRETGADAPLLGGKDRRDIVPTKADYDDFVVGTASAVELRITRVDTGLQLQVFKDSELIVSGIDTEPPTNDFDAVYLRNATSGGGLLFDNITVETSAMSTP